MTGSGSTPEHSDFGYELWMQQHHCLICGWQPVEGVEQYMAIWGERGICMRCGAPFPSLVEL